jgi:hypothetical protein
MIRSTGCALMRKALASGDGGALTAILTPELSRKTGCDATSEGRKRSAGKKGRMEIDRLESLPINEATMGEGHISSFLRNSSAAPAGHAFARQPDRAGPGVDSVRRFRLHSQ